MQIPIKLDVEVKEDSKGFRKLVELTGRALGWIGGPLHKFLDAKADASAAITKARAEIEVSDLHHIAAIRREHLEIRRVKNIRAVVAQAAPLLTDEVSDDPVDDDWAVHFFEQVQDVGDADMQGLWARILADEVNKPGSFALRTLNCLKTISKGEAEMFENLVKFSWTNSLGTPFIFESEILRRRWQSGDESIARMISGGGDKPS